MRAQLIAHSFAVLPVAQSRRAAAEHQEDERLPIGAGERVGCLAGVEFGQLNGHILRDLFRRQDIAFKLLGRQAAGDAVKIIAGVHIGLDAGGLAQGALAQAAVDVKGRVFDSGRGCGRLGYFAQAAHLEQGDAICDRDRGCDLSGGQIEQQAAQTGG